MIDLHGDISIPFLKKSRFTGSYRGMRYELDGQQYKHRKEEPEKTETVLRAVVWPEPLAYDRTPEEKKHSRDFPFETEGIWQAVAWLNEEHEAGHF